MSEGEDEEGFPFHKLSFSAFLSFDICTLFVFVFLFSTFFFLTKVGGISDGTSRGVFSFHRKVIG
jgi:hypothetical protein